MVDKKDLTKLVWAFSLGNGGIRYATEKSKNAHYYLKQLAIHEDYVLWQKDILENICGTRLYKTETFIDSRGYTHNAQYTLITRDHPFFTRMRERMYINNVKQIHPHDIKLLDWHVCAILFQDDGWLETKPQIKETYVRIGIATHNFTYGDNELLRIAIKERLGIHFEIKRHKQKSGVYRWFLRASKDQAKRFIEGITPYIQPSFAYKVSTERLAPTTIVG